MIKINEKVFNKICKKIDELVISKKRKAMKNSSLSSLYTISVIVFLKGKKIKFERVSVFNESGKWLQIYYFDEDNLFYIESCSYMNQEDLVLFSKIITIIFKHLNKI